MNSSLRSKILPLAIASMKVGSPVSPLSVPVLCWTRVPAGSNAFIRFRPVTQRAIMPSRKERLCGESVGP